MEDQSELFLCLPYPVKVTRNKKVFASVQTLACLEVNALSAQFVDPRRKYCMVYLFHSKNFAFFNICGNPLLYCEKNK